MIMQLDEAPNSDICLQHSWKKEELYINFVITGFFYNIADE